MAFLANILSTLSARVQLWAMALTAVARLAGMAFSAWRGPDGTFARRLGARITTPEGLRLVFSALRALQPNLALSFKAVMAYDNTGTALVSRFADVKEVLARPADFEVVYQPRMEMLTGGANFFLGMQDTARYARDVSNMRLAARREDAAGIIAPFVAAAASAIVAAAPGRIDVPRDLGLPLAARMAALYFGVPRPAEDRLIAITTTLFWYLFIDLGADAALDARAVEAAEELREALDGVIAARKATSGGPEDVLSRCLALQRAGAPGMDDISIRNNLLGLLIGAVPTTSRAATQALDQLLLRPDALAGAQQAARDDNDALLADHVFEALRFNPVNPVIYRRAARDTVVAAHTLRQRRIAKGTMVMAANLSAMFDPLALDAPNRFRTDRPAGHYILWGDGQHTCFGAHINRVAIPGLLKPLLQRPGLRRAAGPAGQIDTADTPFPVHFGVQFGA